MSILGSTCHHSYILSIYHTEKELVLADLCDFHLVSSMHAEIRSVSMHLPPELVIASF